MASVSEFGKGVVFTAPIDLGAKKPLDSRAVVDTIAERDAHVAGNRAYPGMVVYVVETKQSYVYSFDSEGRPAWLMLATSATSGISEEQARSIFTEMFAAAIKAGVANDIRTYENVLSFPLVHAVEESGKTRYYTDIWEEDYADEVPSDNAEYVDRASKVEYIWRPVNSALYSGEYTMVNEVVDQSDIEGIFS